MTKSTKSAPIQQKSFKENTTKASKCAPEKGQSILPHYKPHQCPYALCGTYLKCPRMICKHAHHLGIVSVEEKPISYS